MDRGICREVGIVDKPERGERGRTDPKPTFSSSKRNCFKLPKQQKKHKNIFGILFWCVCAGGPAVKSKIPTVPFGRLPSQVDNSNKSATTMATCSPKDPCTAAVPSVVLSVAAGDNVVVVVVVIGADEDVAAVVAAVVASVVAVRFFSKIFQIIPLKEDQPVVAQTVEQVVVQAFVSRLADIARTTQPQIT